MENPTLDNTDEQDLSYLNNVTDDLDFDDKSFIMELVTTEMFSEKDDIQDKEYRCIQPCEMCESKSGTSLGIRNEQYYDNLDFRENEDDFNFCRAKRRRLIKVCIHRFFERKWRQEKSTRSSTEARLFVRKDLKRKIHEPLKLSPNDGKSTKSFKMTNESNWNCRKVPVVENQKSPHVVCKTSNDNAQNKQHRIPERRSDSCQVMSGSVPKETNMDHREFEISDEQGLTLASHSRPLVNGTHNTKNERLEVTVQDQVFNIPTACPLQSDISLSASGTQSQLLSKKIDDLLNAHRANGNHVFNKNNDSLYKGEKGKSKRFEFSKEESHRNKTHESIIFRSSLSKVEPYRKIARASGSGRFHLSKEKPCNNTTQESEIFNNRREGQRQNPNKIIRKINEKSSSPTYLQDETGISSKNKQIWENHKTKRVRSQNIVSTFPETFLTVPMEDRSSKFFIDEEAVDIEVYQDGLAVQKWNPTQALFEICAQCQWPAPEYLPLTTGLTPGMGFHSYVTVQGQLFTSQSPARTKKEAKHLASSECLKYMGFRFQFHP